MPLPRLTPDIERHITAAIRGGAFAHVAAESVGVPRRVLSHWLARGRKGARGKYRRFWLQVVQAKAQCRLGAELEARRKDAKFWLRYGPGKEAADAPAWVPPNKLPPRKRGRALADEELQRWLGLILQALAPHPEARMAIIQMIESGAEAPPDRGSGES